MESGVAIRIVGMILLSTMPIYGKVAQEVPLPHEITFSNLGNLETSSSTFYVVLEVDFSQALATVGSGATLTSYYRDL